MSSPLTAHTGGCHCGALALIFSTSRPVAAWSVRRCGCTFCRAHNASYTSDPAGRIELCADPALVGRYRFATGTADFLFCTQCSVYVGAVSGPPGEQIALVNVNVLRVEGLPAPSPATFDGEGADDRQARRRRAWSPFGERAP